MKVEWTLTLERREKRTDGDHAAQTTIKLDPQKMRSDPAETMAAACAIAYRAVRGWGQ